MKVSLIIPTRNEEGCIGQVLDKVPRKVVDEIIVVDGCSTDNTVSEVKDKLEKGDRLIMQKSQGYGGAFREGFRVATGDVIVMMDADGSHNPRDIPRLVDKINEGYEYVMASRYMKGGKSRDDTFIRWLGNQLFTRMTNAVHGTNVSDSLYLFTAITKRGLDKLELQTSGFEFCIEVLVKAYRAGLEFAEVPAIEPARLNGQSKVNAFYDGLRILRMIFKRYD